MNLRYCCIWLVDLFESITNCRVSALVQVNKERLPIGCLLKFDAVEGMFEFGDSRMYLPDNPVIFIVSPPEDQIPK
jgi:hypothetical protein